MRGSGAARAVLAVPAPALARVTGRAALTVAGPAALATIAALGGACHALRPGEALRDVPGWEDRPYIVHVPAGYDAARTWPVVLVLHGGGGNAWQMRDFVCPDGDRDSPGCMNALADREGFLVVYANGTGARFAPNARTWNAGGGSDGWQCVSGRACAEGIDDVAYFGALLDGLAAGYAVDPNRVFATGISNGGAMAHRLACELGDRIAAAAPVAGGNQIAAVAPCAPPRPVPVVAFHGTEDGCWAYEGGSAGCLQRDGLAKVSVEGSMLGTAEAPGWAIRNGCSPVAVEETLPDMAPGDGTTVTRLLWTGCSAGADVVLYRIDGGGHTWPDGQPYGRDRTIGPVSRDINANALMWAFFVAHPR